MKTGTKILIFALSVCFFTLLLDYTPMLYSRLTGDGGTFVEHYHYDISGHTLLNKMASLKTQDKSLQCPNDKNILGDTVANYTYVKFFDSENKTYFHTWVRIDTIDVNDNSTELIFYGVSETPDKDEEKRINHDFDYITRLLTIKRFEKLIKNRIDNLSST